MQAKTWSLASCQLAWLFFGKGTHRPRWPEKPSRRCGSRTPSPASWRQGGREGPGFASRHARADPLEGSRFPEKSHISLNNICACGSSQPPACEGLPGPWVAVVGCSPPAAGREARSSRNPGLGPGDGKAQPKRGLTPCPRQQAVGIEQLFPMRRCALDGRRVGWDGPGAELARPSSRNGPSPIWSSKELPTGVKAVSSGCSFSLQASPRASRNPWQGHCCPCAWCPCTACASCCCSPHGEASAPHRSSKDGSIPATWGAPTPCPIC